MQNKSTAYPKIGFVSLGCPKATVDSEHIITQLRAEGYETAQNYKEAGLIIVNTCGFIDEAVQESLDAINEALDKNGKVIVTGCLGARKEEDGAYFIKAKFPNILAVTGPDSLNEVMDAVHKHLPRPHEPFFDLLPQQGVKLTPRHYAYLKISEGCNHNCTFCIIPSLRGKLVSYPISDVMQNAKRLLDGGVKELLVISQDTGAYGVDSKTRTAFWGGKPLKTNIASLVGALGDLAVPYEAWVRLHYVYPYKHIDQVIPLMASRKILPYLDVPFQHAHPDTLRRMQRPANAEKNLERIQGWREICPDIAIRSTFITGFPGETEEEFEYLLDFIREAKIDRLGCFAYSSVEGARANALPNQVPQKLREERRKRLMQLQSEISNELLKKKVKKTLRVLIDETPNASNAIGRTYADAPDIDGIVQISRPKKSRKKMKVGEFINVRVTQSDDHDLYGEWMLD